MRTWERHVRSYIKDFKILGTVPLERKGVIVDIIKLCEVVVQKKKHGRYFFSAPYDKAQSIFSKIEDWQN